MTKIEVKLAGEQSGSLVFQVGFGNRVQVAIRKSSSTRLIGSVEVDHMQIGIAGLLGALRERDKKVSE